MDAGMCSLENADLVTAKGRHYLFGLKQDQPTLLTEAQRLLAHLDEPVAETVDVDGGCEVRRGLYLSEEMAGFLSWKHLRTVLRVESTKTSLKTGRVKERESRYFISSLPMNGLTKGKHSGCKITALSPRRGFSRGPVFRSIGTNGLIPA